MGSIPNVRKSLQTAAKGESFISFESLRSYSFEEDESWQSINSVYKDISYNNINNFGKSPLAKIQQVFQQPYFCLAGATQWSKKSGTISELSNQDICALDDQAWVLVPLHGVNHIQILSRHRFQPFLA